MKQKQDKKTTTLTLGDVDAQSFGIDTSNGVIFDILRNKMYSNKVAAVAREITSNARDANRENKKTDTPIIVQIVEPNVIISSTDMQIVFKDFGTGITPDRMANIFLNYGASTKRNTNKQTGGFGLGAKTPFAYTDTFTVITVYKGDKGNMKDTYTASITDRKGVGSGEMILFSSEATKDETGTSIVVPIRESDRYEFEKEVYRATAFWKVKPTFKGFKTDEWKFKVIQKGEGYSVIEDKDNRFANRYLLAIDGIPYEIDRGILNLSGDFLYGTKLVLVFHYNNGDLTISANREAVQYDRLTKTKMLWRIRQVKNVFLKEVQVEFAKQKTYLAACIFANVLKGKSIDETPTGTLLRNIYANMMPNNYQLKFGAKNVVEAASFKWHELVSYKNYDDKGKLVGERMNIRTFDERWNTQLVWMDAAKRDTRRNATLVDEGGFILVTSNELELKEGKDPAQVKHFKEIYDKAVADQKAEKVKIEELGLKQIDYSDVVQKVMPKGTTTTEYYKKTNEVGVQVRQVSTSSIKDWVSESIMFLRAEKTTMNGKMYIYCETNKLSYFQSYAHENPAMPSDDQLAKGRIAAKILNMPFVIVPEASLSYFTDAAMMTIDEAWDKALLNPTTETRIIEALNYTVVSGLCLSDKYEKLNLQGRITVETEEALKLFFNKKAAQRANNFIDDSDMRKIGGFKANITVSSVEKELKVFTKKYPMMKTYLDGSSWRQDETHKEMNLVMDAIDAMEKMPQTIRKATLKGRIAVRKQKGKFNNRKKS